MRTANLSGVVLERQLALPLVGLSLILGLATAYAMVEMADRVGASRSWGRSMWLAGGAAAVGVGVWSADYVGALAAQLPLPVWYHWPTIVVSLFAATTGATAAISTLRYSRPRPVPVALGSALAVAGFALCQLFAARALRLAATEHTNGALATIAVGGGAALWGAAVWLWYHVPHQSREEALRRKVICVPMISAVVSVSYFLSIAATTYSKSAHAPTLAHSVDGSTLGALAVSIATIFVLGLAVLTATYDRRLTVQRATLRSAERRYRHLFQRTPAGLLRTDRTGRILDCNLAAAHMFGFETPEELQAEPMVSRYVNPADREALFLRLDAEPTIRDLERPLRRKDGSVVWVIMTITVAEDPDGGTIYDGMMIDVTDKKRLERDLLQAQKLEAVGGLAAGIAHEINTPVQFMSDNTRFVADAFAGVTKLVEGYQELLTAAATPNADTQVATRVDALRKETDWEYVCEEAPKALSQMQEGLARVATIVKAMKDFSLVNHGAELVAADLNAALESTLVVARNEVKYVAEVQTDFGVIPRVMCHLGDLNQVFLALVINAAHAIADVVRDTGTRGRIDIRTRQNGAWVEIEMADTGTGIPEGAREKVFDPFFTTKDVGRGIGQGLAMAHNIIVDQHGGTLTFDTETGKGTTFRIRLPVSADQPARAPLAA